MTTPPQPTPDAPAEEVVDRARDNVFHAAALFERLGVTEFSDALTAFEREVRRAALSSSAMDAVRAEALAEVKVERNTARAAVALLIAPVETWHDDDVVLEHQPVMSSDGDGWNEPMSEDVSCSCQHWDGPGWVQTPGAKRPEVWEYGIAWAEHVVYVLNGADADDRAAALDPQPGTASEGADRG